MNALIAMLMLWPQPGGTVQSGRALLYSPNVMERVYQIRINQGLVEPGWHGGLASTPYCKNIGRTIAASFRNPHTGQYSAARSLLVVDCSRPGADQARHLRANLIIEVDWGTAHATGWGSEGRTQARIQWR